MSFKISFAEHFVVPAFARMTNLVLELSISNRIKSQILQNLNPYHIRDISSFKHYGPSNAAYFALSLCVLCG